VSRTARFVARDAAGTIELGRALGRLVEAGDVIVLAGDLGSGKTTLVKGLAEGMGVVGHVTSPSFALVQVYPGETELAHIDLYRIEDDRGLDDLGLGDVLYGPGVAAVEWGDRFAWLFAPGALFVTITYVEEDVGQRAGPAAEGPEGARAIEPRAEGERAAELLEGWVAACAV
jgi:tRNA threonylcarbamoyladenosine biosynthesis protein TsaE